MIKRLEILSKDGVIPQTVWDKLLLMDSGALMLKSGWSWEIPQGACMTCTNSSMIFMLPNGGEDVHLTFCDKTDGIDKPLKPLVGFEGMLNPECSVKVLITGRDIENNYEKLWIGDLVDTFIMDDSQRDDRDPDEMISFREGRGCGCIRRTTIDDYTPRESIMMFDMVELTTLEQDILISMFEGRRHER